MLLKHSSEFERKTYRKNAKIVLFIKKHPLVNLEQILKNVGVTENRKYLKKYLKELVERKIIIFYPELKAYTIAGTIPESKAQETFQTILQTLIQTLIHSNEHISPNGTFVEPKPPYVFGTDKTNSLEKQIFNKYYLLYKIKKKITKTLLSKINKQRLVKVRKKVYSDKIQYQFNFFMGDFINFLQDYERKKPRQLYNLAKKLDEDYKNDDNYAKIIQKGKRPFREIVQVALTSQISDMKEASKKHLEIRRKSSKKHGIIPKNTKVFPERLRHTKNIVSELSSDGIIDANRLLGKFEPEIGRIDGVDYIDYHNLLSLPRVSLARALTENKIPRNWNRSQKRALKELVGTKQNAKKLLKKYQESSR